MNRPLWNVMLLSVGLALLGVAAGCVGGDTDSETLCQQAAEHAQRCMGVAHAPHSCDAEIAGEVLGLSCDSMVAGKAERGGHFDRVWCHLFRDQGSCEAIMRIDQAFTVDDSGATFWAIGDWQVVADDKAVGGSYHVHDPDSVCRVKEGREVNSKCFSARWNPQIDTDGELGRKRGYYLIRLYYRAQRSLNPHVWYSLLSRSGGRYGSRLISQQANYRDGWTYMGPVYLLDHATLRASVYDREKPVFGSNPSTAPVVADAAEFIPLPHYFD